MAAFENMERVLSIFFFFWVLWAVCSLVRIGKQPRFSFHKQEKMLQQRTSMAQVFPLAQGSLLTSGFSFFAVSLFTGEYIPSRRVPWEPVHVALHTSFSTKQFRESSLCSASLCEMISSSFAVLALREAETYWLGLQLVTEFRGERKKKWEKTALFFCWLELCMIRWREL